MEQLIRDQVGERFPAKAFIPGVTPVPPSGKSFDASECLAIVEAALDGWWTEGRFAKQFELDFARGLGRAHCATVNSGSSANLLALSALTSRRLGARQLKPGDEVITVAAGFPSTITPIVQNRCVPVFVDIDPFTYNINLKQLEAALSAKTKAVMIAHTLGNPFPATEVLEFCQAHGLWLIEDACDALGSFYQSKKVGTFGHISTFSFYPAHHITMGEGGALVTDDALLDKIIRSFRDWGRDCWCPPGKDNTCRCRFGWKMGTLPSGYDHKYIYSEAGYNLKLTDMQAALGLAQFQKLEAFGAARRANYKKLREGLRDCERFLQLPDPTPGSDPSWFGFLITVKKDAPFTRQEMVRYLDGRHIGTRNLFAGNMTRQPVFAGSEIVHRVVGGLEVSDEVMLRTFWIGCHPALTTEMLDYVIASINDFCATRGAAESFSEVAPIHGKSFLVTGGTGFIGRALTAHLRRGGAHVVSLARHAGDSLDTAVDLTDRLSLERVLAGCSFDGVFHLAAVSVSPEGASDDYLAQTNVKGTENLLAVLQALPVCPVVVAGSWTEYGVSTGPLLREDQKCDPLSHYGRSKLMETLAARTWAEREGRPLTILRFFNVYGPGEAQNRLGPTAMAAYERKEAPELSHPSLTRDFVYIDDVIDGCLRALTVREPGVVLNLGTGKGTCVGDYVATIRSYFDGGWEPSWGTREPRAWDVPRAVADVGRLQQFLHWQPQISVEEGIRRVMKGRGLPDAPSL
ncbi:MAG: lipopolysaccharide biosynthesis protein RfbH [bacterium]|nr:lipopolysaccharide biosynthesis protein RfbH [bacterium]